MAPDSTHPPSATRRRRMRTQRGSSKTSRSIAASSHRISRHLPMLFPISWVCLFNIMTSMTYDTRPSVKQTAGPCGVSRSPRSQAHRSLPVEPIATGLLAIEQR
jgi:hypothetical protein